MGPIPLVPGSWLSYMHSSLSPLGVNLCVLVVPQLLWRQVLHLLLSRLQEGGSWTLSYEKMFSSLRPSLVDHPCYKQTFSMLVILRAHPKPIHSHQLCLFSQTKTQNTITSLLSTPLFLWTFSHSCIVSNVKNIQEWAQACAGAAAFLAKAPEPMVHLQVTWGSWLEWLWHLVPN